MDFRETRRQLAAVLREVRCFLNLTESRFERLRCLVEELEKSIGDETQAARDGVQPRPAQQGRIGFARIPTQATRDAILFVLRDLPDGWQHYRVIANAIIDPLARAGYQSHGQRTQTVRETLARMAELGMIERDGDGYDLYRWRYQTDAPDPLR